MFFVCVVVFIVFVVVVVVVCFVVVLPVVVLFVIVCFSNYFTCLFDIRFINRQHIKILTF